MSKTTKKTPVRADSDDESALQMVQGMLQTGLTGLNSYVDATSETIAESRDVEAAESFAHLLTKVAQVAAELRKAEAADRKANGDVGLKQFVEWLRRATPAERKQASRAVLDADTEAGRSALA